MAVQSRSSRPTGRFLWLALNAAVGYVGGFLFLEIVGWLLDPISLVLVYVPGRRKRLTPETLVGFGVGFAAIVDVRLWRNLFLFHDPSLIAWTGLGLATGPGLAVLGLWLAWRQRREASLAA
jgi:hypothetical protein